MPNVPSAILDACPREQDEAIAFLRAAGMSKIQSMAALVEGLGLSLQQAKVAVHESPTWADVREHDDRFHDSLFEVLGKESD